MKILICGGYGFVGTNIFNFLKKNKTHKIYRFKSSEYNLKILNNSKKVIKKYNPDLIINCAGRVGGILVNQNKNLEFLNDNFLIDISNISYIDKIIYEGIEFKLKNQQNLYLKEFNINKINQLL